MKEIEENKKKEKELQQKKVQNNNKSFELLEPLQDDIALVVCMLCLLALTTVVVIFKVGIKKKVPFPSYFKLRLHKLYKVWEPSTISCHS